MTTTMTEIETPIGPMTIVERAGCVIGLTTSEHSSPVPDADRLPASDSSAAAMLADYFAGEIDALDRIPVETAGTAFQEAVWRRLRAIPAGTTITYAELARRVGRPKGFRAVGRANGTNPVWIAVPCHRVIASDGSLQGYGGGLDAKAWLLRHEGITP